MNLSNITPRRSLFTGQRLRPSATRDQAVRGVASNGRPRTPAAHALVVGFLACAAAGPGLAADLVAISASQRDAFGIRVEAPVAADGTLSRRFPAQVAVPNRQLRVVSAPQDGIIDALLVAEGERVSAGQPLAELSSPGLVDTQSAFLEAVTRRDLAASELERDRRLASDGLIAERRLFETRAKHRELTTLVEQQRQRLGLAGLSEADIETLRTSRRLSSTLQVRAPLAGVVLEQMVATGESVVATTPLYRIADLRPLWLEVHVPVDRLGGLAPGGRVLLPAEGSEGRIITVGRMVHDEDQGVLVRAEISDGAERLRPGQFVEVQLAAGNGSGWRVPAAAVVRNAGKAYVFVERDNGFEPTPVDVLGEEERSAILSGALDKGVRVAVSGLAALKAAWLGGAGPGAGGE